jgi:hypothetical protein
MRKIRSDALWHKLMPEQQKKIEHWFFVENLSYRAVHQRMREEFGVACAPSIIGRMYHHCNEKRSQEREAVMDRLSEFLVEPGADLRRVAPGALTVVSGRLLHRALQKDDVNEVAAISRVMLTSEANEIARARASVAMERLELRRLEFASAVGATKPELAALSGKSSKADDAISGNCGTDLQENHA